uniref:Crystallin alpha B n=1 Tax=Rhipicephalus zambeziensis TaxID=60191 RepID=A0A224YMB4_9ACAR
MLLYPIVPSYADVLTFAEANPWVRDSLPPLTAPLFDQFLRVFAPFEPRKAEPCAPDEANCPPPDEGEVLVGDKGEDEGALPNVAACSSSDDSVKASAACAATSDDEQCSLPEFSRSFDVAAFVTGEITVKAVGNCVEVHAGHLEKPPSGEDGDYVRREYTHRFTLPDDVRQDSITSVLTEEGTLVVRALRNDVVCAEEAGSRSTVR